MGWRWSSISPEASVDSALEISRALKEHPKLQLRMGVHSGPVSGVIDVNERTNVAGAGINLAQWIMEKLVQLGRLQTNCDEAPPSS